MCNNGITQFYLPLTDEPYLPLLPATRHHRPAAGMLIAPNHEGMTSLS